MLYLKNKQGGTIAFVEVWDYTLSQEEYSNLCIKYVQRMRDRLEGSRIEAVELPRRWKVKLKSVVDIEKYSNYLLQLEGQVQVDFIKDFQVLSKIEGRLDQYPEEYNHTKELIEKIRPQLKRIAEIYSLEYGED
jgi:hypothetical protein